MSMDRRRLVAITIVAGIAASLAGVFIYQSFDTAPHLGLIPASRAAAITGYNFTSIDESGISEAYTIFGHGIKDARMAHYNNSGPDTGNLHVREIQYNKTSQAKGLYDSYALSASISSYASMNNTYRGFLYSTVFYNLAGDSNTSLDIEFFGYKGAYFLDVQGFPMALTHSELSDLVRAQLQAMS